LGSWRIVEMELWERADIDMLGRGYIRFDRDGTGESSAFWRCKPGSIAAWLSATADQQWSFRGTATTRWIRPAAEAGRTWMSTADCAAGCSFISATTSLYRNTRACGAETARAPRAGLGMTFAEARACMDGRSSEASSRSRAASRSSARRARWSSDRFWVARLRFSVCS